MRETRSTSISTNIGHSKVGLFYYGKGHHDEGINLKMNIDVRKRFSEMNIVKVVILAKQSALEVTKQ